MVSSFAWNIFLFRIASIIGTSLWIIPVLRTILTMLSFPFFLLLLIIHLVELVFC
nr:MAG TPA: hypothetical protein [Microviridae sp.]